MGTLFLICAVLGGTLLICQLALTLFGLGHHDMDVSHDIGHDFTTGGDVHGGTGSDHATGHQGSSWLFGAISIRTVVAGLTFFGLSGLAARNASFSPISQWTVAVACGAAAFMFVHSILRAFRRLGEDGTLRISRAIGQSGTVYLPIPAARKGSGKIQVKVLNRLVEYEAVTAFHEQLPTGAKVVVVGIVGDTILEVEPVLNKSISSAVVSQA